MGARDGVERSVDVMLERELAACYADSAAGRLWRASARRMVYLQAHDLPVRRALRVRKASKGLLMAQLTAHPTFTEEVAELEKNEDGTLTPDESSDVDEVTVLDQLFTLIRARHAFPPPAFPARENA
jgi:hypothetical protein